MRLTILCFFLLNTLFAAEGSPIGKISAIEGTVKAIAEGAAERTLSKGSDIFVKETIVVGAKGKAQIQFTDGGLMNLIPDTEFKVNSYRYKEAFKKDQSSSELVKGGLRTLTGSISKKNPDQYEIKTPSATIGTRGTVIEVRIGDANIFFGVESGKAIVSNEAGSKMIGIGEAAQFATVPGKNLPPELVIQRPDELQLKFFTPPQGAVPLEQAAAQQEARYAPPSQQPGFTTGAGGGGDTPPGASVPSAPSIGETQDEGSPQMAPMGGGASVGSGC